MAENIHIEQLVVNDAQLVAHVHLPGDGHSVFIIDNPNWYHPAMREALLNLNQCVQGAIVDKMRAALEQTVPPSKEPQEIRTMGYCRICAKPVATDDPGMRLNGPNYYCAAHA